MAFQSGASSSSSPSSSPPIRSCNHDIFLSFRGEDVRDNFISHLHKALVQRGINTYIDNNLERGEEISPALFKAIEGSIISIIVLSKNYAESKWCLDELLKILDCKETIKQIVLPIFFQVDPSEVRHQNGIFGKSFDKLGDQLKDKAKMLKWKEALEKVAHISGFSSTKFENESECIEKIVQEVSSKLPNRTCLHVAKYPIGLESRVEDINMLLCNEIINETRMIGIFGIGGIGKTTISKELYNRIADQFEGSCFLANVREKSKPDKGGLVKLQKKILYDILRDPEVEVDDVDRGINLIQEKLCCKKVLLVLDDIDCSDQLENLSGSCDWFGLGSRIIITTRDEHLLDKHDVGLKYPMNKLDPRDALKLFSWHAFKRDQPDNDFVELTKLALQYAGGLPLALNVVGSNLCKRDIHFWRSELEKYQRIPHKKIYDILKISFDGLDDSEKNIFLDIACFFKGDKREYVTSILDNCDFFAYAGIKNLNDKCLITIDQHDQLMMHDLLEDMGKEIVRQESPKEPGMRSRLWFYKDVLEVLEKKKGTDQIEGILINLPWKDRMIRLGSEVFEKMERLRILIVRSSYESSVCGGLNYLPNELKVLDWPQCSLEFLPSSFHGEKLIAFNFRGGNIRDLGTGLQSKNLISIDLSWCVDLTNISDLSSCSNLEKLILHECRSLVEVHDSVGFLDKLVKLDLGFCYKLKKLPRSFKLRCLELLELRYCRSLEYFPEIECKMEHLKCVEISSSVIQELPSSIKNLTGLNKLYLKWCESLVHLPINIFQMERLKAVSVNNCPNFVNFVEEVGHNRQSIPCTQENEISSSMELLPLLPPKSNNLFRTLSNLWTLNLSGSGIVSLPPCIEGFVRLARLSVRDCKELEEILHLPPNIEKVDAKGCSSLKTFLPKSNNLFRTYNFSSRLWTLNLSGSCIVSLPPCIERFVRLSELDLANCKKLEEILHLPPNIEEVDARGCSSLKTFLPKSNNLFQTYIFSSRLWTLNLSGSCIVSLPPCIEGFVVLFELDLANCKQLEEILHLPPNIEKLHAEGCCSLKNFLPESNNLSRIYNLSSSLGILNLSGSVIVSLPPCIEGFVGLFELNLAYCKQLEEILHLPPNIEEVDARGCVLLERFPHVSTESTFGTPDLKRLTRVNLSQCNKVKVDVGNHAPDPLSVQECFRERKSSTIIYPGSRIPEWFKYRKKSYRNFIEIEIDHNASMCFGHQIEALVLCFVVGPLPLHMTVTCISINGQRIDDMEPHHVYLKYMICCGNSIDEMLSRSYWKGKNNMRFTFGSCSQKVVLKSVGVHLIYGNDNLIDPIQRSKRYQDDEHDFNDLEPDWNPQQKRQSSTSSVMEFKDTNND